MRRVLVTLTFDLGCQTLGPYHYVEVYFFRNSYSHINSHLILAMIMNTTELLS